MIVPCMLTTLDTVFIVCLTILDKSKDLDLSIGAQQQALQLTPDGYPHRPQRLNACGYFLYCRFHHLGDVVDLDEAIAAMQQAVRLTPDGHPDCLYISVTSETPSVVGLSVSATLPISMKRSRRSSRQSVSHQMATPNSLDISIASETPSIVGLSVSATLPISMKRSRRCSRQSVSHQMATPTASIS